MYLIVTFDTKFFIQISIIFEKNKQHNYSLFIEQLLMDQNHF